MSKVVVSYGSFPSMLLIAFIVLKLMGYINWSWWLVLCPIWIPLAVIVFAIIASIITGLIVAWRKKLL